jgi:inorganic pyrophosphatase
MIEIMDSSTKTEFWDFLNNLVASHTLVIDRPKGSQHPRYSDLVYPLDYGYLEGTTAIDGGGIDVWLGTAKKDDCSNSATKFISALVLTVDLHKNDTEIKILLDCNEAEIQTILAWHNSQMMRAVLVRKPAYQETP